MHKILNYVATVHFPLNSATTKHSPTVFSVQKSGFHRKESEEKPPNSICVIVGHHCCYFHYRKCFLKIAMLLVSPILRSLPDNINKTVTKLCQKVPALTLFTLEGRYNLRRSFESYYGKPWLQWQADGIDKPTLPCLGALLIMFLRIVQLFSSFSSNVRPPALCI